MRSDDDTSAAWAAVLLVIVLLGCWGLLRGAELEAVARSAEAAAERAAVAAEAAVEGRLTETCDCEWSLRQDPALKGLRHEMEMSCPRCMVRVVAEPIPAMWWEP